MKLRSIYSIALTLLGFSACNGAFSQVLYGTLVGGVTDSDGKVICRCYGNGD